MKKYYFYFIFILFIFFLINCFSTEKKYTNGIPYHKIEIEDEFTPDDPQFETGCSEWKLEGGCFLGKISDYLGHYIFSIFSKIIILNWSMTNHNISKETKDYMEMYLKENGLKDVKVRFNQYSPGNDFYRLRKNKNMHPSMKYTFGLLVWILETLFPERLFAGLIGGDHYNQFTNTIHIYSDLVPVIVHEGGHAKDFSAREYKSLYSLFRLVPIGGALYQEARASDDAIRYFRHKCDLKTEVASYKQLYPAYGTYVGGIFSSSTLSIFSATQGHIWGSRKAKKTLLEEIPECKDKESLESQK